jgi:hypothetical protein
MACRPHNRSGLVKVLVKSCDQGLEPLRLSLVETSIAISAK